MIPKTGENKKSVIDSGLTVLLLLVILASVAVLIYVIVTPKQGEKFTEFYILGPGGKADDYPTNLRAGENGTIIVGVVNHEYQTMDYIFKAEYRNKTIEKSLQLLDNQTFENNFTFTAAGNQTEKLLLLLYRKDNATEAYRSLHLWVTSR
jgi:uncharacterized membrane protein